MDLNVKTKITAANGCITAVGTSCIAVLAGVILVSVSAASGLIIGWLFPQTFAAFMNLVGLGQYSLWQLAAVTSYIALILKPFK